MRRTLTLKKETLTELVTDDLRSVVGAAWLSGAQTCPVGDCLNSNAGCVHTVEWACVPTYRCTPPPAA